MTPLTLSEIADWVPKAVVDAALRAHAELKQKENATQGLGILSRLISNRDMKPVWQELYKRKRDDDPQATAEFQHPARVTNRSWALEYTQQARKMREKGGEANASAARLLEAEAAVIEGIEDLRHDLGWNEQDLAAQTFLKQACYSALDIQPIYLSDLEAQVQKFRGIAASLYEQSVFLKALGLKVEASKLKSVALRCEYEALRAEPPDLKTNDPWVIVRDRGIPELRTYIVSLSTVTTLLFGKPLYGTLARVANVVFEIDTMTAKKVRELLR